MKSLIFLIISLALVSCGKQFSSRKKIKLQSQGQTTVILSGVLNHQEILLEAKKLNLEVKGDEFIILSGDTQAIENLTFETSADFDYVQDTPIEAELTSPELPHSKMLYLARKDMGLINFLKEYPRADGRGVKVGVIDDGISPHQAGFTTTSTGERKFLKKASNSSFSTFSLSECDNGFCAVIDEKKMSYSGQIDLNGDSSDTPWKVFVTAEFEKACIDSNNNSEIEAFECKGSFSKTGEFFLLKDSRLALLHELNSENKTIKFFQPEKGGDSHGEGVAGVLAGHKIGNLDGFDGVAPGAQILDYDLSEATNIPSEREFTLATFLTALEWLGKEGADVANISYSLFFTNARTQTFMARAIDKIVKKYNIVISFSAGNNGPGLGSLNRRGIYPSTVLVAGAYVSKQLDEIVHGVTGLPEEGRVVYYSSRGPGLGVGPLLITPLSSLVPSTPDSGHRAFSGTSSAAPALAGTAAVLISALKQESIPVNAATVVQALRLSGKRLMHEPFIFQGYGLPQVDLAFRIYKDLITGQRFAEVRVNTEDATDGVAHSGLTLKTSEHDGVVTKRISLAGVLSPLAPSDARVNLLTPVKIEYPEGISGANNLWISSSASTFFIDIDIPQLRNGKIEKFGEIKILSGLDNSLLAIIPVTLIHDQNVLDNPSEKFILSSQQGLRFPLDAPHGVKGFKVNFSMLEGDRKNIVVSIFDPSGIRTIQQRLNADIWVPTPSPGLYQVGLSMVGGTARQAKIEVKVDTLDFRIRSKIIHAKEGNLTIANFGQPFSGILRLTPKIELMERITLSSKELSNGAIIVRELTEGNYVLSLRSFELSDINYLSYTCSILEEAPDIAAKFVSSNTFSIGAKGAKVSVRCMPFDLGGEFDVPMDWELRLEKLGSPQTFRIDAITGQIISIKTKELMPGTYNVEIVEPFNNSATEIGNIEVI
jgi:subtilisin family serine protease